MILNYQLLIVIITIFSHFCIASKFHKTLSGYENGCNVGQNEHFFEVSSVNKNLKNNMERLNLKFYVMADSKMFILLSEVDNPRWLDENKNRGYEIVLGSESLIKNSSYDIVHKKDSPNLFSEFKPKPVEIIITNDNEVIVNIPGYSEPFMKYSDTHSVNIKFFRLGSHFLSSVKWFYNCTFDENSNVEDQKMSENEVKTDETKKTNVNQQQLCEDQKMPENEVKTVETKKTNVNQKELSEPKPTAKPIEKNNEEQLLTAKLSAIDPCLIKLKEYFWFGTRPFSKHNLFFDALVPMLDKFDDNKMLDFHIRVLEVIKELKNTPTTTTKKPVAIDVRIGNTEESSCSCS